MKLFIAIVAPLLLTAPPALAESRYVIDLADTISGRLAVTLETRCDADPCHFELPVWNATYQVRDFSQFVGPVEAVAAGTALKVEKTAPSRWTLRGVRDRPLRLRYQALADRPGPFGAFADGDQVTLNLAQALLYRVGRLDEAASLDFVNLPPGFKEALTLTELNGVYRADSYWRLVDTPVHLSEFEEASFAIDGKQIRMTAFGPPGGFDLGLLNDSIQRIVRAARDLMGELPFDRYTFVFVFSDFDGGGMEFRDGSIIYGPANCRTCTLAGLSAHEFFHLWNVKRIRPASMEPVDFSRPNPSPSLWFAEGVTSTYAEYLQIMAGLIDGHEMLAHVESLINDYEARPASRTQSAETSSIEAWLERYPAYGRTDRSVSYYLKGELIGHLLDLEIRSRTANRKSFDDVLRELNQHYAAQGRFYDDTDAIERAASEVAGADLAAVFRQLVRSADEIPWDRYLGYAGFGIEERNVTRPDAGLSLANPAGRGVVVAAVDPGGPADRAGFRRGDRILRIDGRRITGGSYEAQRRLEKMVDREVDVIVERSGLVRTLEIRPRKAVERSFKIVDIEQPTPEQLAVRRGWLTRLTGAAAGAPPSE